MKSYVLDLNKLPPLPVTLEDAHREIRYLQNEVMRARIQVLDSRDQIRGLNKALRAKTKNGEAMTREVYKIHDITGNQVGETLTMASAVAVCRLLEGGIITYSVELPKPVKFVSSEVLENLK